MVIEFESLENGNWIRTNLEIVENGFHSFQKHLEYVKFAVQVCSFA